jgi:hypothetical protein
VLTKDGICNLVDVIITDPIQMDLFSQSCATQGFVVSNVVQAKEQSYPDRHLADQFFPLIMKVFGYLHKHVDVFLHNCPNAIWSMKRLEDLPFSVLVFFLGQKKSITLQRLQTSSILNWAINIG